VRTIAFFTLFLLAGFAAAQDGTRGSTPPGMSQDGAHPAAGAIQGGSIVPGEKAGVPQKDAADPAGSAAAGGGANALERCYQLEGTLREQCLRKEAEAARAPTSGPAQRRD
jgi:hypothetical protein